MADYELVSKILGFSVTIDGQDGSVDSGYVHATPFVAVVNLSSGSSPATVLNGCKFIWNFGDGYEYQTTNIENSNIQSAAHTYNWPGIYEVKLSVVSNDGLTARTFSKRLSANNFLQDSLTWNFNGWSDLSATGLSAGSVPHGFQSCKPGTLNSSTPLAINFTTTTTLSERISFNLYSQNSYSQPWDIATYENKFANLRPRWRFLNLNEDVITTIEASAATLTPIYINKTGSITTKSSGTLVGYTGAAQFYYVDDLPSLSYNGTVYTVSAPILWVVANTYAYPNYQDKNDGINYSYSNSVISLSSYFYVKNLSATSYNITLNGGSISLPNTIWPSASGNFFITVNSAPSSTYIDLDYASKVLLNYPINYSNSTTIIFASPSTTTFANTAFNFSRTDTAGRNTGGFVKNTLYITDLTSNLLSSGTSLTTVIVSAATATVISEPPPDALSGYNPNTRIAAATAYNAISTISLSGSATYSVVDFDKVYFTRKVNENFNYGAQLQTYALQPTISVNDNLFTFLSAIAGSSYTTQDNFGTKAFEKTANFVANIQDVDVAEVNSLYSLTDSIDNKFDNFNLNVPPVLKRAFDLYSVSHDNLWGTREKYNLNFDNSTNHTNLGTSLTAYDVYSTIVSAGQKIVLNDIVYSNFYELLEVPKINSYASVTAANMQGYFPTSTYPVSSYPLTAYPLSAFFGWGVKTPVAVNYKFWVYNDVYSNTPVNGLIDWNTKTDGLSTTLSETASSTYEWYKDGGILENIYSYYIYKGLNLS